MADTNALVRVPAPEYAAAIAEMLGGSVRAPDVACVALGPDGLVQALSLTETADVELVGGECFALYETVPAALPGEQADALLSATYRALDEAFNPDAEEGPIGLCLLIADRREMKRRPEAFWADPPTHYAGFLGDGRLVRVAYFSDAMLRGPA